MLRTNDLGMLDMPVGDFLGGFGACVCHLHLEYCCTVSGFGQLHLVSTKYGGSSRSHAMLMRAWHLRERRGIPRVSPMSERFVINPSSSPAHLRHLWYTCLPS